MGGKFDLKLVASKILKSFPEVFSSVDLHQITELVEIILTKKSYKETADESAEIDLNAVSEEENLSAKAVMEVAFQERFISPENPNYVYDKRVEFKCEGGAVHDWDDDDAA